MSNIEYEGPNLKYTPAGGDNRQIVDDNKTGIVVDNSYAHKQYLIDQITELIAECNIFISDLETDLSNFALPVNADDTKLVQANASEWPSDLGPPKNFVSYRYYKSLELRHSNAAIYIRRRYEEAARNVTANNSLDLLMLTKLILNEAFLVQEFITTHVGILDDSSERRAVELLQDWVESALSHQGDLRSLFQTRTTPSQLASSDVDQLSQDEASNSQALFKVNLNKINGDLDTNIAYLKKNFSDYAPQFYNNFLGPAIDFRLNVTRKVYPILPGQIGKEVNSTVSALNNNLTTTLADQTRRNMLFDTKMSELTSQVQMRDTYVAYINQLAPTGTSVPDSNRSAIQATDTPDEAAFFTQAAQTAAPDTTSFGAAHADLTGLEDPSAHAQYLIKYGDTMQGDLQIQDGVKIDGMVPHLHEHTGLDGTAQIHGANISSGTLSPTVIDSSDIPIAPTTLNLDLITTRLSPPGITVVDADLSWDGDDTSTFEVQITVFESV